MDIALDRAGEIPLGVQLAWALRTRILAGQLTPGDRLPTVRELAASTGVNVNTIRSVYARLEADGLARSEHGRGTFVAATAPADERLSAIARHALDEATTAGLDPRDVAAALYARVTEPEPPAPVAAPATSAERRRLLRAEIAALERELSDVRLARALRDSGNAPPRSAGGRLLSEDDLRTQRDELATRLAAVRAPAEPDATEPRPRSRRSATRPGFVVRLSPSPG